MSTLYGIIAEFPTPESLVAAAQKTITAGYRRAEAYSPFPIEGLAEALASRRSAIPLITLIAGCLGSLTGFGMCWYANVLNYPLNIGGRPYNSWPAWIPITFEMTVLFAATSCAASMLFLNGLPRLHHPIFNAPGFEGATQDRFFLCIEARDAQFNQAIVQKHFESLSALRIAEVPA